MTSGTILGIFRVLESTIIRYYRTACADDAFQLFEGHADFELDEVVLAHYPFVGWLLFRQSHSARENSLADVAEARGNITLSINISTFLRESAQDIHLAVAGGIAREGGQNDACRPGDPLSFVGFQRVFCRRTRPCPPGSHFSRR